MRRYLLYLLLALHGWALCSLHSALPPTSDLLREADQLFQKRNEESQLRLAWDLYQKAFRNNPDSSEAAWKFSMACQSLAARYGKTDEEQTSLFKQGADVAQQAAERNPQCGPCQFWTAINMAQYGEKVGVIKMLFTLSEIVERLEKAASLSPDHAMAGPDRVLGTVYQTLPGILGGDDEKARKHFEKAIEHRPDEPVNYLSLAKLLKETENTDEALRVAQKGLEKLKVSSISLESQESKSELLDILEQAPMY